MNRPNSWGILWALSIVALFWCGEKSAAQNVKLYVGNSRGDDISIIDVVSLKVTGTIKAAERIHGVCAQADGKRLFVTVESDHTLRIIDTASQVLQLRTESTLRSLSAMGTAWTSSTWRSGRL